MSVGSQRSVLEADSLMEGTSQSLPAKLAICHMASGDRWAGAEAQLAALIKTLAQRQDFRLSAILLNEGRLAEEIRQCRIELCVIPEAKHNFLHIISEATRFLRKRKVQILHSHRYKENLLAAFVARRCRIPVHVSSRHGAPEPFAGWRQRKQDVIEALDRWVARHFTDCVVSVSDELRMQLSDYLPATKLLTIHNGIDAQRVFSSLSVLEAKQRLGIPANCWVIGTAGRLDPVKRLDIFLTAAREVTSAQPNSRFILAGEGREESRLRVLVSTLGLQDRVLFLGHRNDVYDVLRAMDIFVLCSEHEGLPMVLLEALLLGVAVVARPVGGIPEVVQDSVTAVFVNSAEPSALASACLELLAEDDRRKRIAAASVRLVADQFTTEQTGARVAQLYHSLVAIR